MNHFTSNCNSDVLLRPLTYTFQLCILKVKFGVQFPLFVLGR